MIVKILNMEKNDNDSVNLGIEIREDDGTLVFSGTRGFFSQETLRETLESEIKEGIKNIYLSVKKKQNSKLAEVSGNLVGTKFRIKI